MDRSTNRSGRQYESVFLLVGFIVLFSQVGSRLSGETVALSTISESWKNREATIHSIEMSWKESEVIAARSRPAFPSKGARQVVLDVNSFVPSEELSLNRHCGVAIDGGRLHYSYKGQCLNPFDGTSFEQSYVSVLDGTVGKNLIQHLGGRRTSDAPATGVIEKDAVFMDELNMHMLPILAAFRPTRVLELGIGRSVVRAGVLPSGRRAVIIERRLSQQGGETLQFWAEHADEFLVVRVVGVFPGGATDFATEISYAARGGTDLPIEWTTTQKSPLQGVGDSGIYARVENVRLNELIDSAKFDIKYPEGTALTDKRDGRRFITRVGGDRLVTDSELRRGANYNDLVSSESGEASRSSSLPAMVYFCIIVLAAACIPVAIRWYSANRI